MSKIKYDEVESDEELFECYRSTFKIWFNMQLTRRQYVEFVEACQTNANLHLNPFSMCAYLLKKPVNVIVDRFFEKRSYCG